MNLIYIYITGDEPRKQDTQANKRSSLLSEDLNLYPGRGVPCNTTVRERSKLKVKHFTYYSPLGS